MIFDDLYSAKEYLLDDLSNEINSKVFNINGQFLSGKTRLAEELLSDIDFINQYQIATYINGWDSFKYNYDLSQSFLEHSNLKHPEFNASETSYFRNYFLEQLSTLQLVKKDLFSKVNTHNLFSNDNDLSEELSPEFESSLKKNVFLNSIKVSVESLLMDLINNFFPLNESYKTISDYVTEGKKIRALVILDDLQGHYSEHLKYFSLLLEYLQTRNFSELEIYDYKSNDNDIPISELFCFHFLIISRDKKYLLNSEMAGEMKLNPNRDFNSLTDLLENFEPATQFIDNNDQENIIDETLFYLSQSILKYINQDYQRLVIFQSIFEKINYYSFILFPEIQITKNEIDLILNNADFIKEETFENTAQIILYETSKLIFNSDELQKIRSIKSKLDIEFSDIKIDDFEILRELAYFNRFDKGYAIESYFNDKKATLNFINNSSSYFDTNTFTKSIKEDYRDLLLAANVFIDGGEFNNKKQIVSDIWEDYKDSLSQRNINLSEEVSEVGNDLENITSELDQLQTEKAEKVTEIIKFENEINHIEEQLKPFEVQNSSRKKIANILALILSVAIIFNADRISFFLFDTVTHFDYIILFTLVLLIGLYYNGLTRLIKSKLKREEIYKMKIDLQKLIKNKDKTQESADIIIADINANKSKAEELKKHIERLNKQILDNKLKLDEPYFN